jgi:sugar O-acyltransferase (sialic acid O-acetyltransferase NeuD family)
MDSLQLSSSVSIYAVLDKDSSKWGTDLQGINIIGDDRLLPEIIRSGVNSFAVGIGSIGDCKPRQKLFNLGLSFNLRPITAIHETSVLSRWAKVGPGTQLMPCSIVNAGASIGANTIINSGAIIEHDCIIGDHAHIAIGARLASNVKVGSGAFIGAGAIVKQCCSIGNEAIVGAGAVVIEDVPAGKVVFGVPARPKRETQD